MVVVHVVIVPHHDPRPRRMRRLQIRIAIVLGITSAIVVERANFEPVVPLHSSGVSSVLVEVIAKECDEVRILLGHVAERREIC